MIERCEKAVTNDWLSLRLVLWPGPEREHRDEIDRILREDTAFVAFLARDEQGQAVGFAEASLRHDYVNGCTSSPVLFLEGIYVVASHRRQGVARKLCDAVAAWGRTRGSVEFASDTELSNRESQAMHRALGFKETERIVFFRKAL